MDTTNIIAIVAALAIAWFTFKQKRPASVQIAVIIGLLGGGYYFFVMEDDKKYPPRPMGGGGLSECCAFTHSKCY